MTDETWQGIYAEVNEGWMMFLQQLKFALERCPTGTTASVESPSASAGCGGVGRAGAAVEIQRPPLRVRVALSIDDGSNG